MPVTPTLRASGRLAESEPNLLYSNLLQDDPGTKFQGSSERLLRSMNILTTKSSAASHMSSSFTRQTLNKMRVRLQHAAFRAFGNIKKEGLLESSYNSNESKLTESTIIENKQEICAIPAESLVDISTKRLSLNEEMEYSSRQSSDTWLSATTLLSMTDKKLAEVKESRPILVLDLDETLVHSSLMPRRASDFWIEVVQNNDTRTREVFWVYKRPGVDGFLVEMSKHYEIYVFTAGIKEYASQILERLDPSGKLIKGRFYRDECTEIIGQGTYAKDLTKISKDLSRMILVDNTPACFSLQPANGLPIKSWYSDISDRQLGRLREFLIELATEPDVRIHLGEWSMH